MDGVLVIDKPRRDDLARRGRGRSPASLEERRIGHGGTLDPLATGVLVLVCGRATRLVALRLGVRQGVRRHHPLRRDDRLVRCDRYRDCAVGNRPARRGRRAGARVTARPATTSAPPAFSAKKVRRPARVRHGPPAATGRPDTGAGHGRSRRRLTSFDEHAGDRGDRLFRRLLRAVIRPYARATGRCRRLPRAAAAHAQWRFRRDRGGQARGGLQRGARASGTVPLIPPADMRRPGCRARS